jgi:DNA-directed RNA polymerase specialized sigma24 family protein
VVKQIVDGVQQDVTAEPDFDAAPRDPEVLSHQVVVGDIPLQPPGFQPRVGVLARLDRAGACVSVIHTTTGLQGRGATQLAAAYARAKLAAGWRLVAWVNASNTGNLLAGLAAVADAVGLSVGGSRQDSADAGRIVRHWLETDGDNCLLVFDDAENPDVLREFVPVGAARVLITSTRQPPASLRTSVSVEVFSADEALTFLAGPTGLDDAGKAAAVAAELGHLPLALAQAAAVIAGHRLAYGAYLDRLRTLPVQEYLTQQEEQAYPHGVAGAVLLSLQAVWAADRAGVSTRTLEIMAVLSAAGVRRELLHIAGQAGVLASGGHRVSAVQVDRALEWLNHRSLLSFSLDGQSVIMHRLVARVVRDWLARRERLTAVGRVAASVLEARAITLGRSQDRPAVRDIPQQVEALLENTAGLAGEADKDLARIMLRLRFVALYHLIELGDSTPQAIAAGEPLTADLERLLGPDHPDTLNSRNSLAAAYLAADRVTDAIPLFEQTLAARERLLSPDHNDTLTSRNNLASAYQDAGRAADAIPLFELNLAARERLLGVGHPRTLSSRSNLAAAYRDAGRVAEAISLLEQTLADRERVLGPEHPDTRSSRKKLATAHQGGGQATQAIPLFEPTSSGWPRILSPAHPDTQTSRKNLANAYWDGGQVAEDIPPVERVVAVPESQPLADAVTQLLPAAFRRPPADSARRVLPVGFSWPPGDPVRRLLPDGISRRSAKSGGHPSPSREHHRPAIDREVAAAIAAGDPAGIALAYDRYAAALYGYCHWMLHDPAGTAEAVRDTFVIAAATLGDLPEAPELRPWLYAVARTECQRLLHTTVRGRDGQVDPDLTAGVGGDSAQAELRTMAGAILAQLKPREREVIELSLRHDLYGSDLAEVLGMSSRRTNALAAHARARLEKALGALLVVRTGREACTVLGELLADWDGQLTEQTRDLVGGHVEQCEICATHGPGALRPAALFGLLPLAPLPPELREQVLSRCSSTAENAVEERRRVARRAVPTWFARISQATRRMNWDSIGANPGTVAAAVAIALWTVAAVSVVLLTFGGSKPAHAQIARPDAQTSSSSPATRPPAPVSASAVARPSPTFSQPSASAPPPVQSSPSFSPQPSPSFSPQPSKSSSSSPQPSKSSSPQPSKSSSPQPSKSSSSPPPA